MWLLLSMRYFNDAYISPSMVLIFSMKCCIAFCCRTKWILKSTCKHMMQSNNSLFADGWKMLCSTDKIQNSNRIVQIKVITKLPNSEQSYKQKKQIYHNKSFVAVMIIRYSITYHYIKGPPWPWLYGSWIFIYLCNQCISPLMLWVRIPIRVRCTTLCDKVCQWLVAGRWYSPGPPVSSTNKISTPSNWFDFGFVF
jgi:hypothetical protein